MSDDAARFWMRSPNPDFVREDHRFTQEIGEAAHDHALIKASKRARQHPANTP